ncbi:UNVERIFIED_ORG: hypothetical protein HNP28_003888 [Comamonas terrigena]
MLAIQGVPAKAWEVLLRLMLLEGASLARKGTVLHSSTSWAFFYKVSY